MPQGPFQCWSLHFLSDIFAGSRRFGVLAIFDHFTEDCPCFIADTWLSSLRMARELDQVAATRKRPAMIVSDDGAKFNSMAILLWSQQQLAKWHYNAAGKPHQNAIIEKRQQINS
jgi:putative transposase